MTKLLSHKSMWALLVFALMPVLAIAAGTGSLEQPEIQAGDGATFADLVAKIVGLADTVIIPALYAAAFLFFVYKVVDLFFIKKHNIFGDNKDKDAIELREFLQNSAIAFVVMFAVWGIVRLLINTIQVLP